MDRSDYITVISKDCSMDGRAISLTTPKNNCHVPVIGLYENYLVSLLHLLEVYRQLYLVKTYYKLLQ